MRSLRRTDKIITVRSKEDDGPACMRRMIAIEARSVCQYRILVISLIPAWFYVNHSIFGSYLVCWLKFSTVANQLSF